MLLVLPSSVTTITETPGPREVDCGEGCCFFGRVVPRRSVVGLCLAWPGNHLSSGSSQVFTSSLLQVSTLSDFQPYMSQFVKHLQDSDASALRNSVVIEQVPMLPINEPHLGELPTFT